MTPLTNPYAARPEDVIDAPFVGRAEVFARVHALLSAPGDRTLAIVGSRRSGKTAVLLALTQAFPDAGVIVVPCRKLPADDGAAWLLTLARWIVSALDAVGVNTFGALPVPPLSPDWDAGAWFCGEFLPQIGAATRTLRGVIVALDETEALIAALKSGALPADLPATLAEGLRGLPRWACALTIDSDAEDSIALLHPLTTTSPILRLPPLSLAETARLLRDPVRGSYDVADDAIALVHSAAGGDPFAVQSFGWALFRSWQDSPDRPVLRADDVRRITPQVAAKTAPDHRALWERLTRDEQIILRAIVGQRLDDPLLAINAATLARWLLETETPRDPALIQTTLRALAYRGAIALTPDGVRIPSGLQASWLLQNGRPAPAPPVDRSRAEPPSRTRWRTLAIAALLLLVTIAVALGIAGGEPPTADRLPIPPTITLPR